MGLLSGNENRPFTMRGVALEKNDMWLNKIEILGSCVNKICHIGAVHCGLICGGTLGRPLGAKGREAKQFVLRNHRICLRIIQSLEKRYELSRLM